jgi:tRNA1Val (adenine37-N6)-methyltransferase
VKEAGGIAALLLPHHRVSYFITLMNSLGLPLASHLMVKQTPEHNYFRSVLCFSAEAIAKVKEEELIIKENNNHYSERFVTLLKDYYLYF